MTVDFELLRAELQKQLRSADPGHDINHVQRVVETALSLNVSCDPEKVKIVAYLHELEDPKIPNQTLKIEEFLAFLGLSNIPSLSRMIRSISWSSPSYPARSDSDLTDEEKEVVNIVRDADQLDACGAMGIARLYCYCGAYKLPLQLAQCKPRYPMSKEEYRRDKSPNGIVHFFEKVIFLPRTMNSLKAKKMAYQRLEFVLTFLDQMALETGIRYPKILYSELYPVVLDDEVYLLGPEHRKIKDYARAWNMHPRKSYYTVE